MGGRTSRRVTLYDEERQKPAHSPRRPKKRFLRNKKLATCLLIIDLILVWLLVRTLNPLITLLLRNEELFGARVAVSQHSNASKSWHTATGHNHKIPRILHQTCPNQTVPQKWVDSQRSCRETYSDFEYKLWTDESAHDFLASEYPWFVHDWDNYAFPIQRADSIRYFVLYHFGGMYLDMDTVCKEAFPFDQVESGPSPDYALFKSTLPTGITNDFMISTAKHPAYASAIAQLPVFFRNTRFWARLQPYVTIMLASGPFFLTLVVKDYLLQQPSLPSPEIQVINDTMLEPYITDLESSTWHQADAKALMWLGERPWAWFGLGAVGVLAGLYLINQVLLMIYEALFHKLPSITHIKLGKLV